MIGVFTTSALIVSVAAVLTRQAHRRGLRAEAEVAVLEARDRRRQTWINRAGEAIWHLADRDEVMNPGATDLLRELQFAPDLRPLKRSSADHQGAVRIAEARLEHGMEVTS